MLKGLLRDKFKLVALIAVVLIGGFVFSNLVLKTTNKNTGSVLAWGGDDSGQLGSGHLSVGAQSERANNVKLPSDVSTLQSGLRHSLALLPNGDVMAWGNNSFGQMGNGREGGVQVVPKKVEGLPKITMIATRQDHNLALDDTGQVWAWGLNMSGQLGDNTNTNRPKPQPVNGMSDVAFIASGYRTSLAVKHDGSLWIWGGNCNLDKRTPELRDYIKQLQVGGYADGSGGTIDQITPEDDCIAEKYLNAKTLVPKQIKEIPPIASLSAGFGQVLAITREGELWSWGCNLYAQVGNGIKANGDTNIFPAKVVGIGKVVAASAGFRHSLALTADGTVWAWGHNYFGELGNGKTNDETLYAEPIKIERLPQIKRIAAGHDYSLAVGTDGRLWGWGQASYGQLGSSQEYRVWPALVSGLQSIDQITAGGAHVLGTSSVQPLQKDK